MASATVDHGASQESQQMDTDESEPDTCNACLASGEFGSDADNATQKECIELDLLNAFLASDGIDLKDDAACEAVAESGGTWGTDYLNMEAGGAE